MSNDHEWLNLIEVSGPFLAVPVLREVFPQGLEALPSGRARRLRRAYEEWREAVDTKDPDLSALHAAWIDEVLVEALETDEAVLRRDATLPECLAISMPEHGVEAAPDLAVVDPANSDDPLLLVNVCEPDTDLDAKHSFDGLPITPADRLVAVLRATGCPAGIVTNGERWMLVHAPVGEVAGFASWYARLWGQEPETLQAFASLLGVRRLFGTGEGRLPALYARSLKYQDDVTAALGEQVRRAVEVLVQALDRADQDRNRELLRDVDPRELYEAALTVMMRLVFLLAAEERALLLLGDPRYDSFYAISCLRMQLRADSGEILERRRSAWSRLLALFRGVYGGIDHPTLRFPALGGSLFDPDRYPFLEGRKKGTSWRSDQSEPLPIDDRAVLMLLDAIQALEGRALSYRALDVEQIGHVYEGLLERTVKRVDDVTLELDGGSKAKNPRVTLGEMESARLDGESTFVELLKERSERSESVIRKSLERVADDRLAEQLLAVCRGDTGLRDRILPCAPLLRTDPWGYPLVHHNGAFVVVLGADRSESGTHYTPRSLTEEIVAETLAPVAYCGPSEGKAPEEWELKSADDLLELKICDPAMGSGAFLVQACRWLSDRLAEAWSSAESSGKRIDCEGRIVENVTTASFDPLPKDAEERVIVARRLVAERCLYGVDKNPLAVELAKLSLWLTTMSKGRPLGFLDHNLRDGDSLLGIRDIQQLTELGTTPKRSKQLRLFEGTVQGALEKAVELRARLRSIPIRDIRDVDAMAALDAESRRALRLPGVVANALVGIILAESRATKRADRLQPLLQALEALADAAADGTDAAMDRLERDATADLRVDAPDGLPRDPFHWPLEFPEVFGNRGSGFDAIIGNPPFLGGQKITGATGTAFREFLVENIAGGMRGSADLVAYFFLRAHSLLSERGILGLIAVNTISEGDTRDVGLEQILKAGGQIIAAYPNEAWPGMASVVTSRVHISKSSWAGTRLLNGKLVKHVSSHLGENETWKPKKLMSNAGMAFQGSIILGDGFLVDENFVAKALTEDLGYEQVLYPYLIGREVNQHPEHKPGRHVINFFDWPEEDAAAFSMAYEKLVRDVKPERQRMNDRGNFVLIKPLPNRWWQYAAKRPALYHEIGRGSLYRNHPSGWVGDSYRMERVLVIARVSNTSAFVFVSNDKVFSDSLVVFAFDQYHQFAILQSSIHLAWAWRQCSKMKNDMRYTHVSILETFPFPELFNVDPLCDLGERYHETRSHIMTSRGIGLTAFYSILDQPGEKSPDIVEFRQLHREMDEVIRDHYGWSDMDLNHSFHEVAYLPENARTKFTISEKSRLEILRRLSALNKERHLREIEEDRDSSSDGRKRTIMRRRAIGLEAQAELALEATSGPPVGKSIASEAAKTRLRTR